MRSARFPRSGNNSPNWDWAEGRNLWLEYRWGLGDAALFRRYAAELVALGPDVILAQGSGGVGALLQETRILPIVLVGVVDLPVGGGLVASLSRPGGTPPAFPGFEYGLSGKWLKSCAAQGDRTTGDARRRHT